MAKCLDCQHTKYETKKMAGLLCHLLVPFRPWEDLSLDFIVGLSPFCGYTAILVVVDRFSKGIHLGMLPTHHTSHSVAILFMDIMGKIHGKPRSLDSDQDPLFISRFWQELFRLSGTTFKMSFAYHPQTDRQTEVLNRVIKQYLRVFIHKKPSSWEKFLNWVEWSYNTSIHLGSGISPYELTFGKKPFTIPQNITETSNLEAVDDFLKNKKEVFVVIRKNFTFCEKIGYRIEVCLKKHGFFKRKMKNMLKYINI